MHCTVTVDTMLELHGVVHLGSHPTYQQTPCVSASHPLCSPDDPLYEPDDTRTCGESGAFMCVACSRQRRRAHRAEAGSLS